MGSSVEAHLLDFQREALEKLPARGTLWAKRGAGKTLVGLAWALRERERAHPLRQEVPFLVVAPEAVRWNWLSEIKRWEPGLEVHVITGHKPYDLPAADVHIIGWLGLIKWVDYLRRKLWSAVIFDEIHWAKQHKRFSASVNRDGKTTFTRLQTCAASADYLARSVKSVLGMTGTGIPDSIDDVWSPLDVIRSGCLGDFWTFAREYAGAVQTQWGWKCLPELVTPDSRNRLAERLRELVVMIPDAVVNAQLPALRRDFLWIPPKELTLGGLSREIKASIREGKRDKSSAMGRFQHGLTEATWAKWRYLAPQIREMAEAGENVLIFCTQQRQIDFFHRSLRTELADLIECGTEGSGAGGGDTLVLAAHGGLPEQVNRDALSLYMDRGARTILVTTFALFGTGVNIQKTDTMIMATLPWSPEVLLQAEGRGHRIGGDRPIRVYYPLATGNAAEEAVYSSLLAKLPAVAQLTEDSAAGGTLEAFQISVSEEELLAAFLGSFG